MSFIEDREADIKRVSDLGNFEEPLENVEPGDITLGIMNSREKAIYSLFVSASIDYAEKRESRDYQLMMFWTQIMYLEICERLEIWDAPLTIKSGFRIVLIKQDKLKPGRPIISNWPCPN